MKTKEEIIAYLKRKHLYGRFLNYNAKEYSLRYAFDLLDMENEYVLRDGFSWGNTPEGTSWWIRRDNDFVEWFNS